MANDNPNEPMNSGPDESGGGSAEVEVLAALLGRFRHFLFGPDPVELAAEERDALVREAMRRTQGIRPTPSARHPTRRPFRRPVKALAWAAILLVCLGTGVWFWTVGGLHLFRRARPPRTEPTEGGVLGVTPSGIADDTLGMGNARLTVSEENLGMSAERPAPADWCRPFPAVSFDPGSATVKPEERPKVETVAKVLQANPEATLVIEGYCDERAESGCDATLAERRALAVCAYLVDRGIAAERVTNVGYGDEDAPAPGFENAATKPRSCVHFILIR